MVTVATGARWPFLGGAQRGSVVWVGAVPRPGLALRSLALESAGRQSFLPLPTKTHPCCLPVPQTQLIRIQQRVPDYGWTTQKVFHLLNFLFCVLRCVSFALYPLLNKLKDKNVHQAVAKLVVFDLPGESRCSPAPCRRIKHKAQGHQT